MNGIIIQARMTSKRFPGKSMALLAGKPVLQHVIERCKKVPFIEKIIVAMPANVASNPMDPLCEQMEVERFYGPEHDVLTRYYLAASCYELTTIMRITADCPFIDPIVCSIVLSLLKKDTYNYCSNCWPTRTYPTGLDCEVFTFDCLEAAYLKATKPYDREHVTPWMQRTRGIHRGTLCQKIDKSSENWCIDYPDDIPRLEQMLALEEAKLVKSN